MKFLSRERLSQHKYKTPEGYLICVDSVLARTGKQTYRRDEVFHDSDDTEIEVDRKPEEVFSEQTLASFENKPITVEHPDCDVNCENYKTYSVGFVRDVHKGNVDGQDVILGTLVIQDAKTIDEIENGEHVELSCGYDCDIKDEKNPQQRNIRGNHVALCEQGRAGNARIVDTAVLDMALSRADAMDRCISLGKKFISHFDKIFKSPKDDAVQHWQGEMKGWFNSVKEIKLKSTNKPILNSELHDWFFTAGADAKDFMQNPSNEEIELYDKFITKCLSSGIDSAFQNTTFVEDDSMYGLVKDPKYRYFLAKYYNEKWETDDNVAVIKAKDESEAGRKLKASGIKYDSIRELTHSEYIKFARNTKVIDSVKTFYTQRRGVIYVFINHSLVGKFSSKKDARDAGYDLDGTIRFNANYEIGDMEDSMKDGKELNNLKKLLQQISKMYSNDPGIEYVLKALKGFEYDAQIERIEGWKENRNVPGEQIKDYILGVDVDGSRHHIKVTLYADGKDWKVKEINAYMTDSVSTKDAISEAYHEWFKKTGDYSDMPDVLERFISQIEHDRRLSYIEADELIKRIKRFLPKKDAVDDSAEYDAMEEKLNKAEDWNALEALLKEIKTSEALEADEKNRLMLVIRSKMNQVNDTTPYEEVTENLKKNVDDAEDKLWVVRLTGGIDANNIMYVKADTEAEARRIAEKNTDEKIIDVKEYGTTMMTKIHKEKILANPKRYFDSLKKFIVDVDGVTHIVKAKTVSDAIKKLINGNGKA